VQVAPLAVRVSAHPVEKTHRLAGSNLRVSAAPWTTDFAYKALRATRIGADRNCGIWWFANLEAQQCAERVATHYVSATPIDPQTGLIDISIKVGTH
jgi:hypothetical protein